jgi:ubiquinone/menaquinone biosynthesis C-methylase UbiE
MKKWKQKLSVMRRYDLTSQMYDKRYADEQEAKYKAALENLRGGINVDSAVLDVGCGTGLFFSQVAIQANMVVGVDLSRKLLLKAKERTLAFQNILVLQADADHLPFRDAVFDAVFAFTILQNMPKPSETLNDLERVTKLGGKVVVTGLKKAFSPDTFMDFFENTGLRTVSFVDNEDLKCYVAVLSV